MPNFQSTMWFLNFWINFYHFRAFLTNQKHTNLSLCKTILLVLTILFSLDHLLSLKLFACSFRRSGSCTPPTTPVSHDVIELKERESSFASTIPFICLEAIATLGVGGFGRVELVRRLFTIFTLPLQDINHQLHITKKKLCQQ